MRFFTTYGHLVEETWSGLKNWNVLKFWCIFKGGYGIYDVLMEGKGWDGSNMTYEVMADGSMWYKSKI